MYRTALKQLVFTRGGCNDAETFLDSMPLSLQRRFEALPSRGWRKLRYDCRPLNCTGDRSGQSASGNQHIVQLIARTGSFRSYACLFVYRQGKNRPTNHPFDGLPAWVGIPTTPSDHQGLKIDAIHASLLNAEPIRAGEASESQLSLLFDLSRRRRGADQPWVCHTLKPLSVLHYQPRLQYTLPGNRAVEIIGM